MSDLRPTVILDDNAHHAQILDQVDEMRQLGISQDLINLLEKGLHGSKLPPVLRTSKAAKAFNTAFEMIGGVTRLALWADRNPEKFYQLYGRMIPQTFAEPPPVDPRSSDANEMPWITAQRLAYRLEQRISQDIVDKPQDVAPKQG